MRFLGLLLALGLSACAFVGVGGSSRTSSTLSPADAATSLLAGGPLVMTQTNPKEDASEGQDPLIRMTLARRDGRHLSFMQANHAPYDVMAQAPGGPLAQAMGFFGEEAPVLYARDRRATGDVAFICAPEGPSYLGYYRGEDGAITVVGLKSSFGVEPMDDGGYAPLPYSPDQVCARMKFTGG
jgi:hypothetical protein